MSVGEVKSQLVEFISCGQLLPSISSYSLQSKTITLKTGQTCDMSDFMYELIKLTLQNIQLNHQDLVINMAGDAYLRMKLDLATTLEGLK